MAGTSTSAGIPPDGELVPIDATDRMHGILTKGTENACKLAGALRHLALECHERGRFGAACAYLEKLLPLLELAGEQAECLLAIG